MNNNSEYLVVRNFLKEINASTEKIKGEIQKCEKTKTTLEDQLAKEVAAKLKLEGDLLLETTKIKKIEIEKCKDKNNIKQLEDQLSVEITQKNKYQKELKINDDAKRTVEKQLKVEADAKKLLENKLQALFVEKLDLEFQVKVANDKYEEWNVLLTKRGEEMKELINGIASERKNMEERKQVEDQDKISLRNEIKAHVAERETLQLKIRNQELESDKLKNEIRIQMEKQKTQRLNSEKTVIRGNAIPIVDLQGKIIDLNTSRYESPKSTNVYASCYDYESSKSTYAKTPNTFAKKNKRLPLNKSSEHLNWRCNNKVMGNQNNNATGRVVKSNMVQEMILNTMHTEHWDHGDGKKIVIYKKLDTNTDEYQKIFQMFRYANKRHFIVTSIERVQNAFLMMSYLLKKQEKKRQFHGQYIVHEKKYFHGTMSENVDSICTWNYDYRLSGKNRKSDTVGKKVSFSNYPFYATYYGDKKMERKMILTYVLQVATSISTQDTILPDECCDTAISEDEKVFMKYEDNEYYPAYIITYNEELQ